MNTIVDFEIAKLLRLKSFQDPCFYYYMETGKLCEPYLENGSMDFRVDLTDLLDDSNSKYTPTTYSAPTIAEVVMWLYETFGIYIESRLQLSSAGNEFIPYFNCTEIPRSTKYTTPLEAYTQAILYTLNNLV